MSRWVEVFPRVFAKVGTARVESPYANDGLYMVSAETDMGCREPIKIYDDSRLALAFVARINGDVS
jgi:hypothetical protein